MIRTEDTSLDVDTRTLSDPFLHSLHRFFLDILQDYDHYPCIQHTTLDVGIEIYCDRSRGNFHNFPLAPSLDFVKLRQGSGKDRQGMAVKAKGLKA